MAIFGNSIIHGILHITNKLKMGSKMHSVAEVKDDEVILGDEAADIHFNGNNTRITGSQTKIDSKTLVLSSAGMMYGTAHPNDIDWGDELPDGTLYFQLQEE